MALLRNPTHFPDSYLCGTSHESKPTGPTVGSFLIISVQKKKNSLAYSPPRWHCYPRNNSPGITEQLTKHDKRYSNISNDIIHSKLQLSVT